MLEVKIRVARGTAIPLGYGFIKFATYDGAVRCINDLNGAVFEGRTLKVRWAHRNSKLNFGSDLDA